MQSVIKAAEEDVKRESHDISHRLHDVVESFLEESEGRVERELEEVDDLLSTSAD